MDEYKSIKENLSDNERQSIDQSVEKRAIEQLYRNGLRAIPFNIINPLILTVIFVSQQGHPYIYIWLGLHIFVSLLRYAHILNRTPRLLNDAIVKPKYITEFMLAGLVSALIWGIGFIYLSPIISAVNQVIFLLVLAGMAAGAYASMSTHRLTYATYLLGLFVPVSIAMFTTASSAVPGNLLSIFVIAFVTMLLITHKLANTIILNSIRSELVKNILIEKLQNRKSE
jgi:hypothetical protein